MSAPLFFEIRNELLAVALRATLNESYAGRVVERTGVVMGAAEVMVSSQRYDLNSAGNTLAVGGALLVQNIGRAAAAVYAPVRAGGTQAISGTGALGPVPGKEPLKGSGSWRGDNWINIGALPEALSPRMTDLLLLDNGAQQNMTLRTLDKTLNVNASVYNVVDYGALGDGATDDTSAIGDTYTLATAAGGGIYFPRGTYPLDTTAFASDVGLTFAPGAMLTIPTGESVTINGPISAGDQQIFTGDGNVYINNATGINAMWFGVSAANAAADNDAAFARLLRGFPAANATTFDAYNVPSTTTGQVVKLPEGIIDIAATVDITNIGGLTIHGADAPGSHGSTFLAWTGAAAGTMVLMDGTPGSAIGYVHLLGRGIANVGLLLERSNSGYIRSWSTFSNITVSDCAVAGIQISSEDAINLRQVDNIQFYNTLILRCHTGVLLNNRNDLDIHFFTLRVAHNGQAGGIGGIVPTHALWIKYGSCTIHGFDFGGPSFNDFADYAIYLQNGSVQVFGGYSENAKLIKADSTNPSGAIDTTGHTTVGSYVITNMTDTSDFAVFDRVVIDKGVAAAGSQCEVVSKTADSLTVTAIGTSNETDVTVQVAHAPDSNVMSSTLFGFNHLPSLELEAPDYCISWNQAEKSLNIISSRIGQYIYEGTYSGGINVTYSQIHNVPTWTGRTRFSSVRNTRVLRYYGGTGTDFIMNWEGLTGSHTADVARDVMISSNNFYRRDDYLVPLSAGLGSILRQVDSRLILYQQYADYAGQLIAGLSYSHDVLYPIVEAGDSAAKGYHLNLGPQTMTFRGIAPTSGAWALGSVIWNTALSAGQSMGWMCTAAGTFGNATDSTGVTAIGSRVITGVTDTEDFNVGDWVTVDKGILYHPGPFEILAKTASTITVNSAGDSVETNVTIATSDPVFEAMPVLSSGHPVVTLGADAGALLGISGQELSLDAQTANTVFAGPASGAAADPTFRALTLDDMPAGIGGGSVDATDILYADLVTAIAGDDLVPLAWYRITDFATAHYIVSADPSVQYIDVGDIITGANEPLLVQAITTNELGAQAISESYPQDIIRYDWDPDNYATDPSIWEQGGPSLVTGFKGVITFRHDTVSDNYAYYDWRNAKTRRWALLVDAWAAGSYAAGSYVTHLNYLWYAVITTSGVPGTSHDWAQLFSLNSGLIDNYWLPWLIGVIPGDSADFVDVLTFQDLATSRGNHLGKGPLACGQLSTFDVGAVNNVIAYPSSQTFGGDCVGNQLDATCERNTFAAYCTYNKLGVASTDNLFGEGVGLFIALNSATGNVVGASSSALLLGNNLNNVWADGCGGIVLGPGEGSLTFTYQTANRSYFAGHTYAELDSTGADAGDVLTADGSGNSAWAAPGAGLGSGDVVGPAGATDDNIATFNTATGKLLQDGGAKVADLVSKSLYDANSILAATNDNTPAMLAVGEQTVVGRITSGAIAALSVAQLQTLAFSAAIPENVEIQLTAAPSGDGKYSGITEAGVAGTALAFGDLIYFQTADSRWELASADNAAAGHNLKLGICVLAAAGDASATKVLLYGKVNAAAVFPGFTIGAPVYMGTTAGDVQVAAPTGTTDVVRKVGFGNTGDELFFAPSADYLELV